MPFGMSWVMENGFWIVIGIVFVAMHLFGHGGHGGHGRHGGRKGSARDSDSRDKRRREHRH